MSSTDTICSLDVVWYGLSSKYKSIEDYYMYMMYTNWIKGLFNKKSVMFGY